MTGKKISVETDSDMQLATVALIRAAKKARDLAAKMGTEFVVVRDGKLIREIPKLDQEQASPEN